MRNRNSIAMGVLLLGIVGRVDVLAQDNRAAEGAQPNPRAIQPADVFVHVGLVLGEIERIRVHMGQPESRQSPIAVTGAAPREVYFMAETLFRKADRLCFEHTRERARQPSRPAGEIRPSDVYKMVDTALKCVRRVKTKYAIAGEGQAPERDPEKGPTDVLKSIVQANRQLNLMLDRRFSPSDVFQQVTVGVGYSSQLLEAFPEAERVPDEPKFESGKRPADVYRRLFECFQRIRKIAQLSGVKILELKLDAAQIERAAPSDVYDIASLIVAELAHLHGRLPNSNPPRRVYRVGRKFPAHVYQRAGILERQLQELEMWVSQDTDWLGQKQTNP